MQKREVQLTYEQAGEFYLQNNHKLFYEDIKTFISSGPVVAMVLEKENAVEDWRRLMGEKSDTNSTEDTETLDVFVFLLPIIAHIIY